MDVIESLVNVVMTPSVHDISFTVRVSIVAVEFTSMISKSDVPVDTTSPTRFELVVVALIVVALRISNVEVPVDTTSPTRFELSQSGLAPASFGSANSGWHRSSSERV